MGFLTLKMTANKFCNEQTVKHPQDGFEFDIRLDEMSTDQYIHERLAQMLSHFNPRGNSCCFVLNPDYTTSGRTTERILSSVLLIKVLSFTN